MTQLQDTDVASNEARLASQDHMDLVDRFSARNYEPLPVVLSRGEGAWVWDVEGNKYLDCLSAYSALNFGHSHPRILERFIEQAKSLTVTSRAFQNDQFGPFCREITEYFDADRVLPMNTGAEAVETAVKTARKWGYQVKGVEANKAQIIVCTGNFHGRTTTVISFSDDPQTRKDFGPYTPGFVLVDYGDANALRAAITDNTVAFLVEPLQGEGGVQIPPDGYLREVRQICTQQRVLMIADEIQTGMGRTGKRLACDHESVKPDVIVLGKALGGGMMPVSAVVGIDEALGLFKPGDHGSTFGGNPLGCAVAREAMAVLRDEQLPERAERLGDEFRRKLRERQCGKVKEVRGKGLMVGIELTAEAGPAKPYCKQLMADGILCKDTVASVMRIAPPLVIEESALYDAMEKVARVLA